MAPPVAPMAHYVVRGQTGPTARTIIFVHGWPDTDAVFKQQYDAFEASHRIVSLVLPGYRGDAIPFFGYSLGEVASQLQAAIHHAMEGRREAAPFIVAHDWGAPLIAEVLYREPHIADRVVFLDVAPHTGKPSTLFAALFIVAYQWFLACVYLLPKFVGTPLTRVAASVLSAGDAARTAHAGMCYLYLRLWVAMLTGKLPPSMTRWAPPKVPTMFMYGTKKPFFLHSKKWIAHLEQTPHCKVRSFAAGHWFFSRKFAGEVNSELATFLV